ncbi:MAG: hypothetical protein HYS04_13045 [Acidobacteria bacterium]|nr:hypothetical protein [Acidobacteriota bacterium]
MIEVRPKRNVLVLDAVGALDSLRSVEHLSRAIDECLAGGYVNLVVNLRRAGNLGADALRTLRAGNTEASQSGGSLKLLHPNVATSNLLILTTALTSLDWFESEEEAISSFTIATELDRVSRIA